MARRVVDLPKKSAFARVGLAAAALLAAAVSTDCYSNDEGTAPPLDQFYFPVGLQVSAGGNVLYAVNSDFDLQYNGGTLQSYDLTLLRRDILRIIANPRDPRVPILDRSKEIPTSCPAQGRPGDTLGEACAPPVDSKAYERDATIIGAFATDLALTKPPAQLVAASPRLDVNEPPGAGAGTRTWDRLLAPVRGNASLTWASVKRDAPADFLPNQTAVPEDDAALHKGDVNGYAPFRLRCGQTAEDRCDAAHAAGANPDEKNNTRRITMPGEPFAITLTEDGESALITHQNEGKTSLFQTGFRRGDPDTFDDAADAPSLQFILENLPVGGVGLANIPHDRDAFGTDPAKFPRPAFLQTSRAVNEITLLRRYPDELGGVSSSLARPFLDLEGRYPLTILAGGSDSRGIAIDPTPRLACKAKVDRSRPVEDVRADDVRCGRKAARVFIANRSPATLLVGEVGAGSGSANDDYNPDSLTITDQFPLAAGPSKIYLAPVVEADGALALRVFVVCFDSATIFVYDPDAKIVENIIRVGLGPFAMAFDPFDWNDVATHALVKTDERYGTVNPIHRYRFAYVASFTNSFVQVLDLDNNAGPATYERIVFTLGQPIVPKGS